MEGQMTFEFAKRPTIKGYPELRWTGKRPYESTQYYPAQLREQYGETINGWINKIFWGDNLQVMSHLLKDYRGKIDLIYIDPPFDSKADYKKKIEVKGVGKTQTDTNSFEEKQYGDIWTNDEYLQFMYERLVLLKELLSDTGSIFLHCDDSRNFYLRCLLSEIFGEENFRNEIIWKRSTATGLATKRCGTLHDTIYWYSKTTNMKKTILSELEKMKMEECIFLFQLEIRDHVLICIMSIKGIYHMQMDINGHEKRWKNLTDRGDLFFLSHQTEEFSISSILMK